jgi:uncharacterized protein with HEPN domain
MSVGIIPRQIGLFFISNWYNLPDEFELKYPEIDWQRIKGFKNKIVHEYFGVDYEIVLRIKETFLLEMLQKLLAIKE